MQLSVLINTHLLMAAQKHGTISVLYASSACVYRADLQETPDNPGLREEDAYPTMPEDGYGWEKLFSERMCRHLARYHNVYVPQGTWEGGEKAPAAICRKPAEAKLSGRHEIDIWGARKQTRSFTYIDDCVRGTLDIMESDIKEPINLGSDEMVTIDQLMDIVEDIAGVKVERLDAPNGVRGGSSDNTMLQDGLAWAPSTLLGNGLEMTYGWVFDQVAELGSR